MGKLETTVELTTKLERRIIQYSLGDFGRGRIRHFIEKLGLKIAVRDREHLDALLGHVQEFVAGETEFLTLGSIAGIKDNVVDLGITLDLNFLDVSKVTDMSGLFKGFDVSPNPEEGWFCKIHLDISGWNVSNVTKMAHMFDGCDYVDFGDLSKWDRSKVTDC